MQAHEFITEQVITLSVEQREEVIQDFIKFVRHKLHITTKVKIELSYDTDDAQDNHHTGSFNPGTKEMWVYMKNRNLVDILRSICHEFVHVKQGEEGKLGGYVGPDSPLESEAHSVAGYLMKIYTAKHHEIVE
jgi:hypothetical protein